MQSQGVGPGLESVARVIAGVAELAAASDSPVVSPLPGPIVDVPVAGGVSAAGYPELAASPPTPDVVLKMLATGAAAPSGEDPDVAGVREELASARRAETACAAFLRKWRETSESGSKGYVLAGRRFKRSDYEALIRQADEALLAQFGPGEIALAVGASGITIESYFQTLIAIRDDPKQSPSVRMQAAEKLVLAPFELRRKIERARKAVCGEGGGSPVPAVGGAESRSPANDGGNDPLSTESVLAAVTGIVAPSGDPGVTHEASPEAGGESDARSAEGDGAVRADVRPEDV